MLLTSQMLTAKLLRVTSMMHLALRKTSMRMIQMLSVTAVNISILKQVRFILEPDIIILQQADLSAVILSPEEDLIR